jgi:hypothetical protein
MPLLFKGRDSVKIKIIQAGWLTYTGVLCNVNFVEGIAEDAHPLDASRIANIIQIETEDGKNPSASQQVIDSHSTKMSQEMQRDEKFDRVTKEPAPAVVIHSREELEKIASAKGITGLREIANPLGVRSTSIPGLIESIINKQGTPKPAAEVVETKIVEPQINIQVETK